MQVALAKISTVNEYMGLRSVTAAPWYGLQFVAGFMLTAGIGRPSATRYKGPFIATLLNSTSSRVELSCVDTFTDATQLSPTIGNATDPN